MKGVIGIATGAIGRYRAFDKSVYKTEMPEGTKIDWQEGNHISLNYNNMCHTVLNGDYEWLWILGDDHVWHPLLLKALLQRNVDVVVPLCIRRAMPWSPVIHEDREKDFEAIGYDWLESQSGLIELTNRTVGNAGMLIKRRVLEEMPEPWFEDGKTGPDLAGCDLWFCQKLLDMKIKLYLDLDNLIGHLTYNSIWPIRDEDGMYRPKMRSAAWTYTEATYVATSPQDAGAVDRISQA